MHLIILLNMHTPRVFGIYLKNIKDAYQASFKLSLACLESNKKQDNRELCHLCICDNLEFTLVKVTDHDNFQILYYY